MKVTADQQQGREQATTIEFVPKRDLDRAEQQIEKQRREIERLKEENERLRQALEAALRAGKRPAPPHSRTQVPAEAARPQTRLGLRSARTPSHSVARG